MEMNVNELKNDGEFVVEKNINTTGGNVAVNGNINQHYYDYGEINPSFSEIDFDFETHYPSPVFADEVVDVLLQKRVLIVKGNNHFDLLSFGRLLAKLLYEKKAAVKALELIQNEENLTLINELKKQKHERILVFNGIHPRHIDHDFESLIKLCEERKSFYIIGSESGTSTWEKAGDIVHDFWYEIPAENHYDMEELLDWFVLKLNETIPPFLLNDENEITAETLLSDTLSVYTVVQAINTPQKLTIFLNLCRNLTARFSDRKLSAMLINLNEPQEKIVTKWFNSLGENQKLIALTAALFNGLFCHQYFEILTEMIATSFWKQNEETLAALDYHKMDFLDPFFRFETTDEGDLIVARNPTTRVHLLKTAIHQYPRHIGKALEIFSENMQKSYNGKNKNWNLFGTTQKRALIRQVFIESTRDIGINALFNIERIYLELAASNHKFIQGVAAKSLAQYRFFGQDELLFQTIHNWLYNEGIEKRMKLFMDQRGTNKIATIASIKSTIIRVVAYAADYDRPNQLHAGVIDHLTQLANDSNFHVRKAVSQVIPKFIHHHAAQLQNYIFDELMPDDMYRQSISEGLMLAYSNYPAELKSVIRHWLSICTKDSSKENRRAKTTKRDNALIVIVETLSKIEVSTNGFSLQEMYGIAFELLKIEKREAVISAILQLLAHLQSLDYAYAFDHIPDSIGRLSRKRERQLVRLWFQNFVKERAALKGGEFTVEMFERDISIWLVMSERPLTKMEEALFKWINSNSKAARRFATLTFLEIAKFFETEEYEKVKRGRQLQQERKMAQIREQRRKQNAVIAAQQKQRANVGLGLVLHLKIFFYLLFEKSATKRSLKDVIKIFLSGPYSKDDLRFVIYKLDSHEKGEFSSKLAKWLYRFRANF